MQDNASRGLTKAETVADATVVDEADEALESTTETVESTAADEPETVVDETLTVSPAAKPTTGRRWVLPVAGRVCAHCWHRAPRSAGRWQQHQLSTARRRRPSGRRCPTRPGSDQHRLQQGRRELQRKSSMVPPESSRTCIRSPASSCASC